MSIAAGTLLGRYRVLAPLGVGGMGEVYLAEDTQLERRVALKLLPAKVTGDTEQLRRFIQEAKATSALNHPNVVTVYEIGRAATDAGEAYFIATEFIDGLTRRERLSRSRPAVDEVLDLAMQTASALAAAHEAGIVHRDIKPENLMLRRDGYLKVLDFGLAKLSESATVGFDLARTVTQVETEPGIVLGTVAYMSPEQARGAREAELEALLRPVLEQLNPRGGLRDCPDGFVPCNGCCVPYPCPTAMSA